MLKLIELIPMAMVANSKTKFTTKAVWGDQLKLQILLSKPPQHTAINIQFDGHKAITVVGSIDTATNIVSNK